MIFLTLVLLASVDGGEVAPFADSLYSLCADAPVGQQLDGGPEADWLLPHARMQRTACLMATCESARSVGAQRLAAAPPPPSWLAWGMGLTFAFLGGFLVASALQLIGR